MFREGLILARTICGTLFTVMEAHRGYLMRWSALGGAAAFLFGLPFAILGTDNLNTMDFIIAKTLFLLGCLLLVIQAILFIARRRAWMSYLIAFVVCGAIGVAGFMLVKYINQKRDAQLAKTGSSIRALNSTPLSSPIPIPSHEPSTKETTPGSKEKDQNAPKLSGTIEEVLIRESADLNGTQVFILLSIRNTGGTSIAEDFLVNIGLIDFNYKGEPKDFPGETISLLDERKSKITIHFQDALNTKAPKPIERGNLVRGWLMFHVEGVKPEIIRRPKTKFTISFNDILKQSYSATYEMPQHSVSP